MAIPKRQGSCRVVAGEQYLPASLRAGIICEEVRQQIAAQAPDANYGVDIIVQSPSRLTASATVNGRPIPKHKFVVMDSNLTPAAVERFAHSLAVAAAQAARH